MGVASVGQLHLNNLAPQVTEQATRKWARHMSADFYGDRAVKGCWNSLHHRNHQKFVSRRQQRFRNSKKTAVILTLIL